MDRRTSGKEEEEEEGHTKTIHGCLEESRERDRNESFPHLLSARLFDNIHVALAFVHVFSNVYGNVKVKWSRIIHIRANFVRMVFSRYYILINLI